MITKKLNRDRLLVIDNAHVADCGSPPSINASDEYIGYFENPFGEQWIFIGDPQTGKALLRGGDVGWEREINISLESPCPDIVLGEPEKMWIVTCFVAMANASFDDVVGNYNRTAENVTAMSGRIVANSGTNSTN